MTQFQENPDAWQRVPPVLETSSNLNTKVSYHNPPANQEVELINQYIALQILEKLVQTRWKTLPVDQQQGKLLISDPGILS